MLISYFVSFESLASFKLDGGSTTSEIINLQLGNEQDSDDSDPLIKARSSPGDNPPDRYSSYVCIGDIHHKANTDRLISCHFTNLCFSSSQNQWLYYNRNISSDKAPPDIIYDNFDDLKDDFWDEFLLFRHNPPTHWRPHIRQQSAPYSSDPNTTVKWFTDRTVFHYPFVVDNFGHCLGDNYYTIWHLLDLFGDYSPSNTLILFHWNSLLNNEHSKENILKITPYITNQKPLSLSPKNTEHTLFTYPINDDAVNQELDRFDTFCFKDLYIGSTNIRLQRSGTKPYEWNRFNEGCNERM